MKILFIGGTGNISEACADLLHRRGHEVAVLTRGKSLVPSAYRRLVADRHDPVAVRGALGDWAPQVVINFLGFELCELDVDYELFGATAEQYIFISSATVYAKPPPSLPIREEGPFGNPWWDYARKKLACEQWLLEFQRQRGFPVTIVRPSHTFSHRWIPNPVSSSSFTFAHRLERGLPVYVHNDGATPWTLTSSTEFAVGLAGLVGNKAALGESFHITSDHVHSWNEIYEMIASALGVPLPEVVRIPTDFICELAPEFTGTLKGDKAHPGVFDNAKIKRYVPEFKPQRSLSDYLADSVDWLRRHPDQQNLRPELDQAIERLIESWRRAKPG